MSGPLFTLCAAAAAGVVLVAVSARLRIPAIALLLVGGVALGPEGVAVVDPMSLGAGLKLVVGMTVAIILFEGGLTLDVQGARRSLAVIGRMLTIGVLVTWFGAALTIWWIFRPTLAIAVLCGSLVVVTGPTVVAPILRRISVRDRIKHILYWESVLVDAIGVFLAVLCFEWITPDADHGTWSPIFRFAIRVGLGAGVGLAAGLVIAMALRWRLVQDEHINIFVLGVALFTFAACETVLHESGVLAVIVAGLCLNVAHPRKLRQVKRFKLELTELGVGTLFILLAGTLHLDQFRALGWGLVAAVAILTLVVRPVAIALSTWGRDYSIQEKLFLSWVAPRGIVAAFLASLFALRLGANEDFRWEAQLIHTFTFAVIGTTVIVQGMSARWVAKLLHLEKGPRKTWLIVGESTLTRPIVGAIERAGGRALSVGGNHSEEPEANIARFIQADPLDRDLWDDPRLADTSAVLAVSPNLYFNALVCEHWAEVVGPERCFHWSDAAPDAEAERSFVGARVWVDAGTPTDVASGLDTEALALGQITVTDADMAPLGNHLTPLFRVRGGKTTISEDGRAETWSPGDTIVLIRKRIAGLAGLVRDTVVIAQPQPDFDTVLQALLETACATWPGLPVDDLRELIVQREQSMPTAIGFGVAIPHAYHDSVQQPQCYVANVAAGMAGETPDGLPIRLVFLVLSPSGQAQAHLKSLAAIATLCSDPDYLDLIKSQQTADSLLQRIRERE